ncbi:putative chromatin remodeler Bromodomain family [Helianthus annuus]|nr:putative chromatin remodeler Bromodomain family [Helianthus annuus]
MMGKTKKVSKGRSFGFVPDCHHVVETMGDSEGYGSSGRVDMEITGSDDSCAPRNKSMNLNSDSYQPFGVPMQVLSLSKMSGIERKQLESRLKRELVQVRRFRKNIEDGFLPTGDVHSCSAGERKHIPNFSQSTKKRVLPGQNPNVDDGFRSKKVALPPATGNPMLMKQCETLLKRLMGHNFGWVFNTPVDVVALKIPDYHTVIKHPMDLGTVKTKLNSGKYADPWGFAADVRLTFSNAMTYNPRGNDVHVMAETLSKFFEVRWKPIEKKLSIVTESLVPMRRNVQETETERDAATFMPPFKKKKIASFGNAIKQEPVKKVMFMSVAEKVKLSSDLEASLADLPDAIIDFLKENSSGGNAAMDDEIEIDIDILSDETLFKLRKLLDDSLADKQKNMTKAETCEVEIRNESGPSNSSMQVVKDDMNEEDVDIGENDLPITTFPPVEIEKDTAVKNSKCSSSSSSSSDSGSSSSDSDSESDDANVSAVVNNIKDTLGSEVNLEQTSAVPRDVKDSVNRVGQVEQKSQSVPVSGEVDDRQEGVSAPNERRVSPDKLYRAALLRGRFADTILKAQEKTSGKVEQHDRERLWLEKEELEKRRKEEKARLQAEAKAAEEAKRIAELEAAAEAKRKRELDREAARQALQKMEKMVDINDNSRFLEDLEMLSVAPTEPLLDENSVDCFDMNRKGNPLEQLGLYMKNDDEDEEDGDPPAMGDDSEEGEID